MTNTELWLALGIAPFKSLNPPQYVDDPNEAILGVCRHLVTNNIATKRQVSLFIKPLLHSRSPVTQVRALFQQL